MSRVSPGAIPLLLLTFVTMLAAAGCGPSTQISGDLVGSGPGAYKTPISTGVPVRSVRKAAKLVFFPVLKPHGLGPVNSVFVTDPHRVPLGSRALAFVFDDTRRYGPVDVVEEPMRVSRAEYDSENKTLLAENGSPLTHGSIALATVRGDKRALITTSEDGRTSDIFWMEHPGMEISIVGPFLDASDCAHIANGL
ncbi:MAG: hypothetical protein M3P18_18120 [Actinomycetota bacterium]|nr:hypothetical protein [Actinomycetota bacterium]